MIHRRGGRTIPNCSLGIWLRHPKQAHHDGHTDPPDPHGEVKPPLKIEKGPWPARAGSRTPQISTNRSQLSNTKPPAMYCKTPVRVVFSRCAVYPPLGLAKGRLFPASTCPCAACSTLFTETPESRHRRNVYLPVKARLIRPHVRSPVRIVVAERNRHRSLSAIQQRKQTPTLRY